MNRILKQAPFLIIALFIVCVSVRAQSRPDTHAYFTVENYYKVKWGYADEFIRLWTDNHYPLLKKAIEKGDIISVTASKPKLHSSEDSRWDFRVTILFKNAELAFDENLTAPYKKILYPDLDKLTRDEQHRFELLLAHWDIETSTIALP